MQNLLHDLVVSNIFAFMLIFMRFGVALMIMPGIGDSYVNPTVRLLFALALSFVLMPMLATQIPPVPQGTSALVSLVLSEGLIGLFIGTVMRFLVTALDTAGTIVSMQSGLSNASLFNASTENEAPIMSAVYSSLGVTLLFATDLHHQMLAAVVDSYRLFPAAAGFPDTGALSEAIVRTAVLSFKVGAQLAIPFLVVGLISQIGLGLLGRLMPQLQVYFVAMPAQIFLSLVLLVMVLSASALYFLNGYQALLTQSLSSGG